MQSTVLKWQLPLLVAALLAAWSAIFWHTFARPLAWDDLHFIREFSLAELLSTFHGPNDPDGIETPALRPVATLLFHVQGTLFGENVVLQRGFVTLLMGAFLWSVALLLREAGLGLRHIAFVLTLFVASRIFASLTLWVVLGSLILAYTFMVLTALFFLRWIKRGASHHLALTFLFAALAVFCREEIYTFPVALPLLWWLTGPSKADYRRVAVATLGIFAIVVFQYALRTIFIPGAPQPTPHLSGFLQALRSAWIPGGYIYSGQGMLPTFAWLGFLVFLAAAFFRIGDNQRIKLVLGICALGFVLCAPALAVARPFGIALPSLAFLAAISIVVVDVWDNAAANRQSGRSRRTAIVAGCLIGLLIGIAGGIWRSLHVAEALDQNATGMALSNGMFVYNVYGPVTIPEQRRAAVAAHLNSLGVRSREDISRLRARVEAARAGKAPAVFEPPMFLEKYPYMSY